MRRLSIRTALMLCLSLAFLLQIAWTNEAEASILHVTFAADTNTSISTVLENDGFTVDTVVSSDFSALSDDLSGYQAVFISNRFDYLLPTGVISNLESYATSGGFVFLTGYDTIFSTHIYQFVGGTGAYDVGSAYPHSITSSSNVLTTGVVDIRGLSPVGSHDLDELMNLTSETENVLEGQYGGAFWSIRSLGLGKIVWLSINYYTDGTSFPNWIVEASDGTGVWNGALRNFAYNSCPLDTPDTDEDGYRDCMDCQPEDPNSYPGAAETCDGVDNDCDGSTDEDFTDLGDACSDGTGACLVNGNMICNEDGSATVCNVIAGDPSYDDNDCDGFDDNCDGSTDEGYVSQATACGVGACGATGATSCVEGSVQDSCVAGDPTGDDSDCDGIDDDCDGSADEAYVSQSTACGVGACGATGSTSCVEGSVQDSCVAGDPTGDDSDCDGIDDDCDGSADEAYVSQSTACGVGACGATGATSCVEGSVQDSCVAGDPTGDDSDCDGIDDDCDGSADEAYVSQSTACGVGACGATGATSCVEGSVQDSCVAGDPTGDDSDCDGIDDDCDGSADEAYVSQSTACGVGACGATGSTSCVEGSVQDSCVAGDPTGDDTDCDGIDDDCDGSADEAYVSQSTACGVGACGATGATSCVEGSVQDSCVAGDPTGDDSDCDGIDDNCNGSKDENYASLATDCGVGACAATGATSCVAGQVQDSCTAGDPTGDDSDCDGIDDDCDGSADEAYVSQSTACGVGACGATGVTSCVEGSVQDSCVAGDPTGDDTDCDGVDDNCNGSKDENYASLATDCGVGACAATGATSCVAGQVQDSCVAGDPTGDDSDCDGIDDDCDGSADEAYVSQSTACGVGACGATGATSCVEGSVQDSCVVGDPTGDDTDCDGVDDNCNGSKDENYASLATDCGVGACAATGATSCVAGQVQDSCVAGDPTGDDSDCDGVDDNCNGSKDENYASLATDCGVGACAATGATSCVSGQVQDSCVAGDPTGDDTDCDGVDDNCDGTADEAYVSLDTDCGVGACAATGATSCVAGQVQDSCTPGDPSNTDDTCDGVDDNCDGTADEAYVPLDTDCGVGACAATGTTSCVAGQVQDSCVAGDPGDELCDGIDSNCNGVDDIDEDLADICVEHASCILSGELTACACDDGYEGDGLTCDPLPCTEQDDWTSCPLSETEDGGCFEGECEPLAVGDACSDADEFLVDTDYTSNFDGTHAYSSIESPCVDGDPIAGRDVFLYATLEADHEYELSFNNEAGVALQAALMLDCDDSSSCLSVLELPEGELADAYALEVFDEDTDVYLHIVEPEAVRLDGEFTLLLEDVTPPVDGDDPDGDDPDGDDPDGDDPDGDDPDGDDPDGDDPDGDDPEVCTPEEKRCEGDIVMQCDESGSDWHQYQYCDELGLICVDGVCVEDSDIEADGDTGDSDGSGGYDESDCRHSGSSSFLAFLFLMMALFALRRRSLTAFLAIRRK